jgi:hypothetical protein
MNLRLMLKKALGRMTRCRFLVVDMFPGKVRRKNIWTQIGISACVLLLPPILAIAVFAPHPSRLMSDLEETHAAFAETKKRRIPRRSNSFHSITSNTPDMWQCG